MSQVYVLFIFTVHVGCSFRGFEIYVSHFGVITYSFPEHIALIVAQVDAMYMLTGILALHLRLDAEGHDCCYDYYKNTLHTCKVTKNV